MSEPTARKTKAEVKILVVDDYAPNIHLLARALIQLGYSKPEAIHNGVNALEYLSKDNPIEIVIMDTQMPKRDGYDICAEMRQQPYGQRIVILGTSDHEESRKWRDAGADGFLTRNFMLKTPSKLDAAIKAALKRRHDLELIANTV